MIGSGAENTGAHQGAIGTGTPGHWKEQAQLEQVYQFKSAPSPSLPSPFPSQKHIKATAKGGNKNVIGI